MAKGKAKESIKRRKVTFSLEAAGAHEVILVGDFNNWNPKTHPMKRDENGVWNKAVMLPPGKYEYKFLVDGHWKEDPKNEQICPNRFGTYNNIIHLSPEE
ncbi:MAG: glycogen-binding domain-containing protein [Pseudomonadota bacterium]|nr:glycogen-binding domain-containing protein [Pseudomonadota bacterium]